MQQEEPSRRSSPLVENDLLVSRHGDELANDERIEKLT
jgi:hypothetical protein